MIPQLLDLLSISTFYDFGLVREHAIRAIEANGSLDPIDKICYANQCDIPEWLFPAYKELSQRSAPLEASEAERIGLTTAILVAKARERILRDQISGYSFGSSWGTGREMEKRDMWGTEPEKESADSWGTEQKEEWTDSVDAIINSVFFGKGN